MQLNNPSNKKKKKIPEVWLTMKKYPRLTAHLICESLGYFTPKAAANAIIHHQQGKPFFCEWYSHQAMCMKKDMFDSNAVMEIGRNVIRNALKNRKHHKGYMAEYKKARALVDRGVKDNIHPELASWF